MAKYDTMLKVSVEVIRAEIVKGHLKWKVTEVSKDADVARSHIYEILGANKTEILLSSLLFLLEELYGISPEHQEFCREFGEFKGLLRSREIVTKTPELLAFYFRHRNAGSEVGDLIRKKEKDFLSVVREKNGLKEESQTLFIRTFIHGVCLAPFLQDEQVADAVAKLSDLSKFWRADNKLAHNNDEA